MTTTAAQINVRLDADLKRSGDAALSRAGMTPSQAVRALWQLAASLADRPGALEDILLPSRARAEQREREKAAKRKLELMDQGSSCSLPLAVSRESICQGSAIGRRRAQTECICGSLWRGDELAL